MCIECHPAIYKAWGASEHATAFTSPEFQVPYDRIRRVNPANALSCEQCHNPMRFLLAKDDPKADIFGQEGITCDFCHSVDSVNAKGPWPRYRAKPGIKFGPQGGNPKHAAHDTQFSRLHITSEFCAGCHEFRNEYGVPILTTSSEWEQSFYRGEQVHCQFCHLPQLFDARFIDPGKKKGPLDHAMVGGHSRERLAKAIPLRASLKVSGNEAVLSATLRNETVGHKTPSGLPSHRIRLAATLYDKAGNAIGRKEEVFERVLGDGTGKPLEEPELIFTEAREVLKDTRLGPKETRKVALTFPVAGAAPAAAEVSLTYELPAMASASDLRTIDIPISRAVVPVDRGFAAESAGLVAAVLLALLLGVLVFNRWRNRKGRAG